MRILVTCKKRGWNGETACILSALQGTVAAGHQVLVGSRADSEMRRRTADLDVEHVDLELLHEPGAVRALWSDVRKLRRVLPSVDVVHCNASWDTWLVALTRRILRRPPPLLRTRHNLKGIRPHLLNRWLYGKAITQVLAPSKTIAADLERYPFLRRPLAVAQYGIDMQVFDPARFDRAQVRHELRQELGVDDATKVVAYIGRVARRKSPEDFVEAAARLGDRFPNTRFVIAGQFPRDSEWLQALWNRMQELKPHVQHLHFVEDVPRLLAACDVFVLPAAAEPFGLAPVEAMAMGCPPVCADAAGLAESIRDGQTGILYPPRSVDGLAEGLGRLLADEDLRLRLGAAGRPHVKEHFTRERMVQDFVEVYERLVGR